VQAQVRRTEARKALSEGDIGLADERRSGRRRRVLPLQDGQATAQRGRLTEACLDGELTPVLSPALLREYEFILGRAACRRAAPCSPV